MLSTALLTCTFHHLHFDRLGNLTGTPAGHIFNLTSLLSKPRSSHFSLLFLHPRHQNLPLPQTTTTAATSQQQPPYHSTAIKQNTTYKNGHPLHQRQRLRQSLLGRTRALCVLLPAHQRRRDRLGRRGRRLRCKGTSSPSTKPFPFPICSHSTLMGTLTTMMV